MTDQSAASSTPCGKHTTATRTVAVSFSDRIVKHDVATVADEGKGVLYYSKEELHRLQSAMRLEQERAIAKRVRQLVEESKTLKKHVRSDCQRAPERVEKVARTAKQLLPTQLAGRSSCVLISTNIRATEL